MKILCLSDTHGNLPELDLKGIDIVLHAGDYTELYNRDDIYRQLAFFENQFCPWVRRIADEVPHFYYVNGNHEVFSERLDINTDYNDVTKNHCIDMCEVTLYFNNKYITIFGFPYTNRYGNWGFNVDDTPEDMGLFCKQIPSTMDIILSHGPVNGINDYIDFPYNHHAGSVELGKRINQIKPKAFISGHLHCDRNFGVVEKEGVKYVGCSLVDERYKFGRRSPIIIEI